MNIRETCSKCGGVNGLIHAWCRKCRNAYMREARKLGKWPHFSSEYKQVKIGSRFAREHIVVAEKYLGKVFLRHLGLWIHHKDHNPRHNEWDNFDFLSPKEHYWKHKCVP